MKKLNFLKVSVVLTLVMAALSTSCSKEELLDIEGTWVLNPDKTVMTAVASGKVSQEQVPGMVESIGRRVAKSKITVTSDQIITPEFEAAYEVTYASATEVVARLEVAGEPVTLTFTDADGYSIFIRSSATNDMDFLVWDKDIQ